MALFSRLPEYIELMTPKAALALKEAGQLVEKAAKERVPVRTGRLRDAIHTEDVKVHPLEATVAVVAGDSEAFYGHMVEHGTVFSAPHPFLVPALEANRAEILALVSESLRLR